LESLFQSFAKFLRISKKKLNLAHDNFNLTYMRSAQYTLKDLANRLGISPSTVSKALNNHPEISEATKNAVHKLAKELNYHPNAIALSLKHSRSNIIGLIIPELTHYFFSTVISGIEDVAYDANFNVMLCQSNELYFREVKNTETLLASRIDGLLVSVSKDTKDYSHFKHVLDSNIPIVFFDRIVDEIETDRVIADDYKSSYKAVEHLIKLGKRRIAHLGTNPEINIGKNRLNGYRDALRDNNIQIDERLIVRCDEYESARLIVKRLIYELSPPDSFFAVNDLTAIGTLQTIQECGYKVPDDFAVVGFSNSHYSSMTTPQITTVEQNGYKMGKVAARLLIDRILRHDDYPSITHEIETSLIIRGSTQKSFVPGY
jgi:DNA-binding LacI/PurR family transcriptional regulator